MLAYILHIDRRVIVFFADVYLTLNGTVIPPNRYVVISDIGSTDETGLLCHTNYPPPPGSTDSGGDWCAPDGTTVDEDSDVGFAINRGAMVVRLVRTGTPTEGIYKCSIEDAESVVNIIYVGLYNSGTGRYMIIDII